MRGHTEGKSLFTLNDGTKKLMTKQEFRNYLKRLEALKTKYDSFLETGFISDDMTEVEKIHILVDLGDSLMCEICENADLITVTGVNRVQNEVSQKIDKDVFIEFVKFYAKNCSKDKEDIQETKIFEKILKDIEQSVYKINLKRLFYMTFISEDEIVVPVDVKHTEFPRLTPEKNKKFKEILNSCAKTRNYIDKELWPQYEEYAEIAEYVTKGEISREKYKQLVDYQHYSSNDEKRFNTFDKKWQKLHDLFIERYMLCKKYGYDYFDDIETKILNKECA